MNDAWWVQLSFPPPNSFIILVSCICLKISSFLHTCASCTMLHIFFYDGKFYFQLRQLIVIPVWAQLCCGCQGEESPLKVVFNQRSYSTKGCLPWKIVIHQRSYSIEGHLPPTITPWLILYLAEQSTYQILASYFD